MRRLLGQAVCAASLAACALSLAACGKSDEEQAQDVVRRFVEATREGDAEAICDDLVTEEFRRRTTGVTGSDAREACERQLGAQRGLDIRVAAIEQTEVRGDEARVTVLLGAQGRTRPQVFNLRREDGDYRVTGALGGD